MENIPRYSGKVNRDVVNRILFVTVKLKQRLLRGVEASDELQLVTAHMHWMSARKSQSVTGRVHYKQLFDHLAEGIVKFGGRFLGVDAHMSLWTVVPQMRARGVQISLAAWSPWKWRVDDPTVNSDTCGIFIIGPFEGIRYAYGAEVFGLRPANLDHENRKVQRFYVDNEGRPVHSEDWEIPTESRGQGCPITSYLPSIGCPLEQSPNKMKFLRWSFQPVRNWTDSTMGEIEKAVDSSKICLI